jgi:serine/threonine protein kinase
MVGCFLLPSSPIKIKEFKKSDWTLVKELYHERYTTVYVCMYLDKHTKGALKLYSKKDISNNRSKYIQSEINIHKKLDNKPNMLPLWFYFESSAYYALMTKYMNQETLTNYMYKYNSEYCIIHEIVYPLLKALLILHENNIIHRDLKPDNIFLHKNKLYIGDFGYACILENNEPVTNIIGTIQYMAPELLITYVDKTKTASYKYEIDIWSMGIIIYELLCHKKPFGWSSYKNICDHNPTDPDFINKCLQSNLEFSKQISPEAKNFIELCLTKKQEERVSIFTLLDHPWILNYLKTKKQSNEICPLQYDLIYQTKNLQQDLSTTLEKKTSSTTHCTVC